MIVKIMSPSNCFAGVDYNERKVAKGVAELLEIKNFGYVHELGLLNSANLRKYLSRYSARNDRIRNAQLHVAFSCKGDEMSHEQLVEFAHKWLDKMGYGQDGQPLLVYGHHDTDNNHIHIITSRVDPKGNKIDHNFERERSQKVIEELLGENRKERLAGSILNALSYKYANVSQFKAILEASGYETFDREDEVYVKRSGVVQGHIQLSEIERRKKTDNYLTDARRKQLKAILQKYQDIASNKAELQAMMKEKFGIDIIFVGSKDKPYGYMLVDHKDKAVYKGSSVLPLKQLLMFQDKQERLHKLDLALDAMLEDNPLLSTKELNAMLRRQFGVHIAKGKIVVGKDKVHLPEYMQKVLNRNDRNAWLQSFHPATEMERDVLCMFGKVADRDFVKVEQNSQKSASESIALINGILIKYEGLEAHSALRDAGITVIKRGNDFFFIDIDRHQVLNAADYKLKVEKLAVKNALEKRETSGRSRNILKSGGGQASDANREWEVGGHGNYDDIDDERRWKR